METELEQDIKALISGIPLVRLVLLFGSLSCGEGRSDSDLDLAIAGPYPLTAEEKTVLIESLAVISGRPVDLIDLQVAGGVILHEALTRGKLIYCSDRALYGEIIKKMLFDQTDMMPYRERILAERRREWIGV